MKNEMILRRFEFIGKSAKQKAIDYDMLYNIIACNAIKTGTYINYNTRSEAECKLHMGLIEVEKPKTA